MENKILLTVGYDGTGFSGWQKQKSEAVRTVQGCMEDGCRKLFGLEIECVGASRTDRGVHALGQRVAITVDSPIPISNLPSAMNSVLPEDISVLAAQEVPVQFLSLIHI